MPYDASTKDNQSEQLIRACVFWNPVNGYRLCDLITRNMPASVSCYLCVD